MCENVSLYQPGIEKNNEFRSKSIWT